MQRKLTCQSRSKILANVCRVTLACSLQTLVYTFHTKSTHQLHWMCFCGLVVSVTTVARQPHQPSYCSKTEFCIMSAHDNMLKPSPRCHPAPQVLSIQGFPMEQVICRNNLLDNHSSIELQDCRILHFKASDLRLT